MEPSSLCLSVSKLQSLRVFTVGKVDIADLHALSQLPNLAELHLTSIQGPIQDFSTQTAIEFSSLRTLHIARHPADNRFCSLPIGPVLQRLRLYGYFTADIRNLRDSCAVWARCFPSMEDLQLRIRALDAARQAVPGPESQSASSALGPLFRLHNLQSLGVIALCLLLTVSDTDIRMATSVWPNLTELSFCDFWTPSQSEEGTAPYLTPSSLVLLETSFPRLQILKLARVKIDLRNTSILSEYPTLNHSLSTLSIEDMFSEDCSLTALFIDRRFLHLQIAQATGADADAGRGETTWDNVQCQLHMVQVARWQHAERTATMRDASSSA